MPTSTTNFGLQKPLVNSATDEDLWGTELNSDLDSIDGLMKTAIEWTTSAKTSSFSISNATSGTTTTGDQHVLFLCDATAGAISATLPSPVVGFTCAIKKTDSSPNIVTVVGTIDGVSNYLISGQGNSIVLISTATGYQVASDVKVVPVPDATTSVKGIVQLATQAELETPSSSTLAVVPSVIQYHPGIAKAWVLFNQTGAIQAAHNVSSVTRTSAGNFTVNFSITMSSLNYAVLATPTNGGSNGATSSLTTTSPGGKSQTSVSLVAVYYNGSFNTFFDPSFSSVMIFGDI